MAYKGHMGLIVITAIIIGCIFTSGCLNGGDQTNAFITYENNKYVVIKYPDTWAKIENPSEGILITFMPDENNVLLGVFNVSILIGDFLDINSFRKTHIDTLYDMFIDFNISYENSTTLAGREAYAVLFTFRDSGHTFKRLDTWTVDNGRVYLLTYHVSITYYDEYISIIEEMVDYFEIIK